MDSLDLNSRVLGRKLGSCWEIAFNSSSGSDASSIDGQLLAVGVANPKGTAAALELGRE